MKHKRHSYTGYTGNSLVKGLGGGFSFTTHYAYDDSDVVLGDVSFFLKCTNHGSTSWTYKFATRPNHRKVTKALNAIAARVSAEVAAVLLAAGGKRVRW